ncbi:MAG: DUF6541 family protein, partial [Brachybacterium sp.]
MDVLRIIATLGAALLILGAPGLPTVLALRLRPLTAVAAVAPASLLMITIAAEAGHLLGIPWTVASPLVLGLLLGAALWPIRRRQALAAATSGDSTSEHDSRDPGLPAPRFLETRRGHAAAILIGLVIGGGVLLARVLPMMGGIHAISQTYDNIFHLNAVRHILRAGDGSAWVVGGMTALPGTEVYYPAVWHQAVSLVTQVSGQDIILASNVVMLLVAV